MTSASSLPGSWRLSGPRRGLDVRASDADLAVVPRDTREQTVLPRFRDGDLVRYKTGGLTMTVQRITEDGRVVCAWMVVGSDGRYETAILEDELLDLVT